MNPRRPKSKVPGGLPTLTGWILLLTACGSARTPSGPTLPAATEGINPECLAADHVGRTIFKRSCLVGEPSGFQQDVRTLGAAMIWPIRVEATLTTSAGTTSLTCEFPEMTEALAGRLLDHGVKVVERQRLADVRAQLNLSMGDDFDQKTVVRMGKLLSAHVIVQGTYRFVAEFPRLGPVKDCETLLKGSSLVSHQGLSVRFIEVEQGEVLGQLKLDLARNAANVLMPSVLALEAADRIAARLEGEVLEPR